MMHSSLKMLDLLPADASTKLNSENYRRAMGLYEEIRQRMIQMGIYLTRGENTGDPDFLTVNSFLWFVDENKDLIKEKIMAKMFKNASKKTKTGARNLSKAVENDEMMQRLMVALRTKPFAILAGHSGTGKSQLVRRLAYMTCNDEELLKEKDNSNAPGNYCMVQVKPNWHDSTDLLGYYTEMNGGKYHTTPFVEFICKAYAYPETPFFVCLDEMNLAPVEQYFAEFLSAIESYSETTKLTDRLITEKASPEEICGETKLAESLEEVKKHGLTIPRNLFVVGTVNVDETTCQFSRKVLDRAMTILMTAVSFKSMTEPNDPSKEECLDPDGIKFFLERPTQTSLVQGQMDKLDAIQKQVGDTPFAIAYRFANEYALYQSAYQMLMSKGLNSDGTSNPEDDDSQKAAIDHVVLMKLLPRIHGARPEMEVWFNGKNGDVNKIGLVKTLGDGQSVDMMKSILARVGEYLSFWP
jgi:energy-coupling factor transporter ATP-binding protein EcfA2